MKNNEQQVEKLWLPSYTEMTIGDTVYHVSSIFSDKKEINQLMESYVIDKLTSENLSDNRCQVYS